MKLIAPLFFLMVLQTFAANTPKASAPSSHSKLNAQIYEKENEETSFEAKVKVIRDIQGETEVFFEKVSGYYVLSKTDLQELLVQSQKKHQLVRVQVNTSTRQILKVEMANQN